MLTDRHDFIIISIYHKYHPLFIIPHWFNLLGICIRICIIPILVASQYMERDGISFIDLRSTLQI
jgi:hypothetical protein